MYLSTDFKKYTGLEFIDKYHQIIETLVNDICEEVLISRDLANIMIKIDELVKEISFYLRSKQECREKNKCQDKSTAEGILRHLKSFKQTIEQFGETLPTPIAINEIQKWAKSSIYEPDQKCMSCSHVATGN